MIGTTIKNRYRLVKKVGGGGMAEVYKATDLYLDLNVAVKILRQQYVNDEDFIKRFRREAQSVASLSHENVVEIFDVGEEGEIYFIVMEYVEGHTLKELIQERGSIPIKQAIEIAKKIASALEHAHQNNIVHRDIKPHNILIGLNGEVKVTDFGIARAVSQATITHTGSVMGSVHYLSPEQAKGGITDEKSDIYSLGIVIYEMVTGKLPFSGDSPITVALKHLQENFLYPREIDPSIPQSVENIILKALVKDPTRRYASAAAMLKDLETALDPDRKNEPQYKYVDEMNDEERTLVIPAIKDTEFESSDDSEEEEEENLSRSKKKNLRNLIIKRALLFTFLVSLIVLGFYGYRYIGGKFIVPEIVVPQVEGKNVEDATKELEALYVEPKVIERYDPVVKEGIVIRQDPYQGTSLKVNQAVTLYVSLGKERIEMPDVTNKQQGQAFLWLTQKGFNKNNIEIIRANHDETPSGFVFKQEPAISEMVIPEEQKVTLFISQGKENFAMPKLIGLSETEARAVLTTYDLKLGKIEYNYTFDQPKDKIYKQFPYEPNMLVTSGDQIDLYISKGYPEEAKNVTGEVYVIIDNNKKTDVAIYVNDARGMDILWRKETISSTKFYPKIPLLLMPNTTGKIKVYLNGKLDQTADVKFH